MENKEIISALEAEGPGSVNSLLSVGEVKCDKCGKTIRHMERYFYRILECPVCSQIFTTITDRDSHFSQEHPQETIRGTRYCFEDSSRAGYVRGELKEA